MVQWVNSLRNNSFVNATGLPLLCLISGAVHLAQPGLMLGRQAGQLTGWLADWQTKSRRFSRFSKFIID